MNEPGIWINLEFGRAERQLIGFSERGADLSPLMDNIGALLAQSGKDRISITNEAPDGTPWIPSTRAIEDGGKTLQERGHLRDSITHVAGRREVSIGSNLIYARIHQDGGEIKPKTADALVFKLPDGTTVVAGKVTIPARPYLGVSTEDEAEIDALIADYFLQEFGQ